MSRLEIIFVGLSSVCGFEFVLIFLFVFVISVLMMSFWKLIACADVIELF